MAGHGWTWLDSWQQLCLTWERVPPATWADHQCRQLQPNRSDSASSASQSRRVFWCVSLSHRAAACRITKRKIPRVFLPRALSAENVACVNMGNRAVKTEPYTVALWLCGPTYAYPLYHLDFSPPSPHHHLSRLQSRYSMRHRDTTDDIFDLLNLLSLRTSRKLLFSSCTTPRRGAVEDVE